MALFPAYARANQHEIDAENSLDDPHSRLIDNTTTQMIEVNEALLLATDSEEETRLKPAPHSPPRAWYSDSKPERANIAVSTLYYPGRPQYHHCYSADRRRRRFPDTPLTRYYEAIESDRTSCADELVAQVGRTLKALADNPDNEPLWLRHIENEQAWRGPEAALRAAERASAELPGSRSLKAALHRARVLALPTDRLLVVLRETVDAASSDSDRVDAWLRLLASLSGQVRPEETMTAGAAALARLRSPHAYPHVVHACGAALREAGLWERLVLLVELVLAMNCPVQGFPPPVIPPETLDGDLVDLEDKVINSGLPLGTVWVRIERARAAIHWRSATGPDPDPQRRALLPDVVELLQPVTDADVAFMLSVQLLRLANVPLYPVAEHVQRAADAGHTEEELGASRNASGAQALLPLMRAARRLPAAHPARPFSASMARNLTGRFLDQPNYFTNRAGYLTWVDALWETCCSWAIGDRRLALLCWRLRWSHSLLLLLERQDEADEAEARRIATEARGAVRRLAAGAPLAYAHLARIQDVAFGADNGRHVALGALRAALADPECPPPHRLYVARVALELGAETGGWPLVCAALGIALPAVTERPPELGLLERAMQTCEDQCAALERRLFDYQGPQMDVVDLCAAMLPAEAEWVSARAELATPKRLDELLRDLIQRRVDTLGNVSAGRVRFLEQSACALTLAARRHHRLVRSARTLAPLFPCTGLVALASGGAPVCAWEATAPTDQRLAALSAPARSHVGAISYALPSLLRAAATEWAPPEAERVRRACMRASRLGCGGALLAAATIEAEARAAKGRTAAATVKTLDLFPNVKWLYVRSAVANAPDSLTMPDVMLERQLRVHALPDELRPIQLKANNENIPMDV